MTTGQWTAIRRIFDELSDLTPAQADAVLMDRCGDDPAVAAEVRRLLDAHWSETDLLVRIRDSFAPAAAAVNVIGRRVNGYRIVREIGRGGMGSVYLAERADGVICKQVAIMPVVARPDTLRYRAGKLIRRSPAGVAAIALIVVSILFGLGTLFWATRVAIRARNSPGYVVNGVLREGEIAPTPSEQDRLLIRTLMAPQILFGCYVVLIMLVTTIYFTRAPARRVAGALGGGALFAVIWIRCYQLGYSMGWWYSTYPGTRNPLEFVSAPFLISSATCIFTVFVLIGWRIVRRFGWKGQAWFTVCLGISGALSDRLEGSFGYAIVTAPGVLPYASDALAWALGTTAALAAMRVVAGTSRTDELVRRF